MKKNKSFQIQGKVVYVEIGPGFWGILGKNQKEWRPVNFPEQLKHKDQTVNVQAKEVDAMSIFMWGTAVEIISFETLNP